MKKQFLYLSFLTGLLIVCFTFMACGGDDDGLAGSTGNGGGFSQTSDGQSTGKFRGAKHVFGNNLVKAFTSSKGYRYEFTYDANGFMTKAKEIDSYQTDEYVFSYSENKITWTRYKNGTFKETLTASIGSNGFVSSYTDDDETYRFTYDNSDHLTRFIISEEGKSNYDDNVNLTWQNGNVVSAVNQDSKPDAYTVVYQKDSQGPITNDANLVDLDHIASINVDVEDFLVYGGAIGFGPTHLPISTTEQSETKTNLYTNTWQFDGQHRATRLERKKNATEGSYSYSETTVYTWEY